MLESKTLEIVINNVEDPYFVFTRLMIAHLLQFKKQHDLYVRVLTYRFLVASR